MPFVTALTGKLYLGPNFSQNFLEKGQSLEIAEDQVSFFKTVVDRGIARIDDKVPKDILALQEAAMKRKEIVVQGAHHPHRGRPPKEKVKKK